MKILDINALREISAKNDPTTLTSLCDLAMKQIHDEAKKGKYSCTVDLVYGFVLKDSIVPTLPGYFDPRPPYAQHIIDSFVNELTKAHYSVEVASDQKTCNISWGP